MLFFDGWNVAQIQEFAKCAVAVLWTEQIALVGRILAICQRLHERKRWRLQDLLARNHGRLQPGQSLQLSIGVVLGRLHRWTHDWWLVVFACCSFSFSSGELHLLFKKKVVVVVVLVVEVVVVVVDHGCRSHSGTHAQHTIVGVFPYLLPCYVGMIINTVGLIVGLFYLDESRHFVDEPASSVELEVIDVTVSETDDDDDDPEQVAATSTAKSLNMESADSSIGSDRVRCSMWGVAVSVRSFLLVYRNVIFAIFLYASISFTWLLDFEVFPVFASLG